MATDSHEDFSFQNAWSTLMVRIAAGAGATVALCAVLADVPVRIACLRGALTFLGIKVVASWGLRGIQRNQRVAEVSEVDAAEDAA